jgi:hypothetical protein
MGITVAKIMIVEVGRPLLPPSVLSLLPPLLVSLAEPTVIPAIELLFNRPCSEFCTFTAPALLGAENDVILVMILT